MIESILQWFSAHPIISIMIGLAVWGAAWSYDTARWMARK